jgi:hypothetical protein
MQIYNITKPVADDHKVARLCVDSLTLQIPTGNSCNGVTISVNLIDILGNVEITSLTDRKPLDARLTLQLPVATHWVVAKSIAVLQEVLILFLRFLEEKHALC